MKENCGKEKILRVLVCAIVIAYVLPLLRASSLATFRTDDFAFALQYGSEKGNLFIRAFNSTVHYWKVWQGAFASTFLLYLINPLNWYSYRLLRIILILLVFLAIAGLYFCVKSVLENFSIIINAVYCSPLFLLPLISYRDYYDIYAWFVGAVAYLLPVIGFEYGIFSLLEWRKTKNCIYFITSIISFIFMTGCVLEMTGFGMWCLLIIIILDGIKKGKAEKSFIIVFFVALALSCLNAFAPGNFARKGEEIKVMKAVANSLKIVYQEAKWLHSNATFLLFELLTFILGANSEKKNGTTEKTVCFFGLLFLPVITIFPVVLGYDAVSNDLPNRCLFLFDCSLVVCFIGISLVFGSGIRQIVTAEQRKEFKGWIYICPLLILAIMIPSVINGNSRSVPVEIIDNLISGKVVETTYYQRELYDSILESDEEDIVIDFIPKRHAGNTFVKLDKDPESHRNKAVSQYFGKNSIVYISKE